MKRPPVTLAAGRPLGRALLPALILVLVGAGIADALAQAAAPPPATRCRAPLTWRIGTLDPRFGLEPHRVRGAISVAMAKWERAVGRDVFVEDPDADFTISFRYGERQQAAELVGELRAKSAARERQLDRMNGLLRQLVGQYNARAEAHAERAEEFGRRVERFNDDARRFSANPISPAERTRLLGEQGILDRLQSDLIAESKQLEARRDEVEGLRLEVQRRVAAHNAAANDANAVLGGMPGHFLQLGSTHIDGPATRIDLYTYTDFPTLDLTLLHELGHALGILHTSDPGSVMYPQRSPASPDDLTAADVAALRALCGF